MTLSKTSSTLLLSTLLCFGVAQPVAAGQPQFPNKVISINARGQKVSDIVTDIFSQSGFKVKVSSAVTGQTQAMLVGSPAKIWDDLSRVFNLVAYYDGNIVRIYAASEISTRTIQADAPAQLVSEARRLGLSDNHNKLKASKGAVIASGVPDFLTQIDRMANRMDMAAPAAPAVTPAPQVPQQAVAQTNMVASPLLSGADFYRSSSSDVAYDVRMRAGPGRRYETRVYQLRFRDATDKEIEMQGRIQRVPGVATMLMEHMGLNSGGGGTNLSGQRPNDGSRGGRYDPRYGDDYGYGDPYDEPRELSRRETSGPSVTADTANNAVIVKDLPSEMNTYTALIAQLDREQPVIEMEVVSIVYNRDDMKELGVDWSLGIGGLKLLFGGGRPRGGDISGSYVWGNGDVINAQIQALQQQGVMRVTDRQFIVGTNNQQTEYNEGGQFTPKIEGKNYADLRTLSYGLSVRIKPSIVNEPNQLRVRMDIAFRDTTLTNQNVDGIPTTKGPSFTQSNIVPHGQAVILAGRTVEYSNDRKSKTPILGDIPIFGNAFKKRRKGTGTMERVVMIIPRVRAAGGAPIPMQMRPAMMQPQPQPQIQPVQQQPAPASTKKTKRRRG